MCRPPRKLGYLRACERRTECACYFLNGIEASPNEDYSNQEVSRMSRIKCTISTSLTPKQRDYRLSGFAAQDNA